MNALWVVVPPQVGAAPRTLKDLAGAGVQRIALGNPDNVPVGRYGKGALEAAGLWPSVRGRIITTQNVRQSLDYVARGEVDAGFVYATDAQAMPDRVRRAFAVPVPGRIAYPLAVTKASTAGGGQALRCLRGRARPGDPWPGTGSASPEAWIWTGAHWLSLKVAGWATAINLVLGVALGLLASALSGP